LSTRLWATTATGGATSSTTWWAPTSSPSRSRLPPPPTPSPSCTQEPPSHLPSRCKTACSPQSCFRYYNDYNLEYNTNKTDKALELVHIARSSHARIDGVGFQGHLIVGSTPSRADLVTALERFTGIGLDVAYTELDIRFESVPASEAGLAQQGNDYAAVVGSCTDLRGRCIGITQWEFTDKYSWVPATFPGQGEACLYDEDLKRKPAWTSVSSVLKAAATKKPEPKWPWKE
jgi:GH35 family endo-1,4-beta-xylanase